MLKEKNLPPLDGGLSADVFGEGELLKRRIEKKRENVIEKGRKEKEKRRRKKEGGAKKR
jgi:hypothetical protein